MRPRCESCKHWDPLNRLTAYEAPCNKGYGRTAFDSTCREHEPMEPAAVPESIAAQSACRGMTYQEWARKMTGKQ